MKLLFLASTLLVLVRGEFKTKCDEECCQYTSAEGVKVTECSYNQLTQVPQNVSPSTQILDLRGNNIKHIPTRYFEQFPDLLKLYINYNDLEDISVGTFDALTKLTFLDMHENEIKEIPAGLFAKNKALETLKMMELLIESLPTGLYDGLNNLKLLKLGGNSDKLKCGCQLVAKTNLKCTKYSVSRCTFTSQTDIIEKLAQSFNCPQKCKCYKQNGDIVASCSNRGLTSVPKDIPSNVQKLYLNHNDITHVGVDAFAELTKLKVLSLRGNKLNSITSGMFNGLSTLKTLYLNYNQITSIGARSFASLQKLDYLDLHGNLIRSLDEEAFVGLARMRTLDMHNNVVVNLPSNIFQPLSGLLYMRWEGNLDLVCTCQLVKKFMKLKKPGSHGKCSFNGVEKHIMAWGNQVISDPCISSWVRNWRKEFLESIARMMDYWSTR